MLRRKTFLRMVPMLAVMGTIFYLSHQPGSDLPELSFPLADKLLHFVAYGALGAASFYAFADEGKRNRPGRIIVIAVAVSLSYGVLDEYHQSFIEGRYPSGADLLADFLGALVFSTLASRLQRSYTGVVPFC